MGGEFENATPPTAIIVFQPNFSECSLWKPSQKLPIGIMKLQVISLKARKFNIVLNGEMKNYQYLGNG